MTGSIVPFGFFWFAQHFACIAPYRRSMTAPGAQSLVPFAHVSSWGWFSCPSRLLGGG